MRNVQVPGGSQTRAWAIRISLASLAPLAEVVGRFVRTIILSRLLLPEDFGTSVALTVVLGAAMMISDIGLDRFVLFRPDAESRSALAVAHALQLIRGIVIALGMVLLAQLAANFFSVPNASRAFMLAALIPFIYSWSHLGPKQAQREYDFLPDAASIAICSAVSVITLVPAVWLTGNYNAVLVCLILSETVYVVATHALAHQPFEMAWESQMVRNALGYGLPLTLNGLGLALFSQADRALVGTFFGVKALAVYAVIASLAIVAISPINAIGSRLCLAVLARKRSNPRDFPNVLMAIAWGFGAFGLLYCIGVCLTLDFFVPLLFGDQYKVAFGFRIMFAIIAFVRILRAPGSVVLLAEEGTKLLTFANLMGGIGLPIAAVLVVMIPTVESILVGVLVGDLLSLALLHWHLTWRAQDVSRQLLNVLMFEVVVATALCIASSTSAGGSYSGRAIIAIIGSFAVAWMVNKAFCFRNRLAPTSPSDNAHLKQDLLLQEGQGCV